MHQGLRKHRNHVRGFETAQHGNDLSRAGKGPHPEETRIGEYIMSVLWERTELQKAEGNRFLLIFLVAAAERGNSDQ